MAMKLLFLAAAALLAPAAALVTEVLKPGKTQLAKTMVAAEDDAPASPSRAAALLQRGASNSSSSSYGPATVCGMTTPIRGVSPGPSLSSSTGKTITECLDECVATGACLGIIFHEAAGGCILIARTYDEFYETSTTAYVANKLAGANCLYTYDFLFDGCPRGNNGATANRGGGYTIYGCQAECDNWGDCLFFEINGCLNNANCGGNCYTFHGTNTDVTPRNDECVVTGDQKSYLKVAITASPTASPTTASPTAAPTATPAAAAADLIGDPHVTNLLGKRFDLRYVGDLMLLQVPRGAAGNATLLRIDGHTKRVGGPCAKELYLDQVRFTGKWVLERNSGSTLTIAARRNSADPRNLRHKQRVHLGGVYVVVSHAQTDSGVTYMNLHVTKLSQVGMPIGGLLGEDDFSWAYATPAACEGEEEKVGGGHGAIGGSMLVASPL